MYEIKQQPEDFIVEEITPEKKTLELETAPDFQEDTTGEHTVCILEKTDYDTHMAIKRIAKALQCSPKRIGFAGTKDKKAVTIQRISIYDTPKEQIDQILLKDITVKPIKYSDKRINLGDLWGNRFTIKVYTSQAIKTERPKKIPNYFGVQRFGTVRPITHLVGKRIVNGDFKGAVEDYIFKVFEHETPEIKQAREHLRDTGDYKRALEEYPKKFRYERGMINHLIRKPNDYTGALRVLPKNLMIMFVYAYQSHLFNKFLDTVIKKDPQYIDGPLYGYDMIPENDLEKSILDEEGLRPSDFRIRSMPELSSRGKRRPLFVKVHDFKVLEKTGDYQVLRFSLPKGCYATVVIDYLFG